MPELPDSPLHSEDEEGEELDQTPARLDAGAKADFSSTKTPKPPGAWTSTPAPPHRNPLARAHSLPDSDGFWEETVSGSSLPTPVASLSRASSLPPQTPAPPGAWVVTPSLERKRSILKVRFDVESEQSASETPVNGQSPQVEGPCQNILQELSTPTSQTQGNNFSSPVEVKKETVDTPVTPRTTPPSTPRRSPSIRIVDAFGRDAVEPPVALPSMPIPSPPRSKSLVRIVDAMGREVEEVAEAADSEVTHEEDFPLNHNEAVRRVRQSIADLASGLSEVDRYITSFVAEPLMTDLFYSKL
jgi:serine/arginine repetitive matrix protein 2